jgi:hypothetical protein
MTLNGRRIARLVMFGSAGLNLGITLGDLARREYTIAATQSVLVVVLAVWLYVMPRVDDWLDARVGEATAQRQLAETMLKEVQRLAQAGGLRVGVASEVTGMRPH